LTTNSLVFEQAEMERWWKEGCEYAEKQLNLKNPVSISP
jgi:hypothetical protein